LLLVVASWLFSVCTAGGRRSGSFVFLQRKILAELGRKRLLVIAQIAGNAGTSNKTDRTNLEILDAVCWLVGRLVGLRCVAEE
jgi:hypothetical protein